MTLHRLMQIAAKEEAVPGTLEASLFVAANMKYLVIDPTMDLDIPLFEQQHKRASLTKIEGLAGMKMAKARFQLTMHGHGIATPDIPVFDLFMTACGFVSKTTNSVPTTAFSGGPLRHAETVTATDGTGTGASGTATIVHDTYPNGSGVAMIYLADDEIAWATGGTTLLTGGTSGAVGTVGTGVSSSDAGQSWWPVSEPTVTLLFGAGTDPVVGETLTGAVSGAIGIVKSFVSATNAVVRIYNGKMFGASEAVTGSGSASFTTTGSTQTDIPSISLGLIEDGVAKQMSGARGNWSIEANVGEPALMTFEFSGKAEAPADQSLVAESTITYESKTPPVLLSAALVFGTEGDTVDTNDYSPRFSSLGFNLNNEVNPRTDANEATGILEYLITGRGASGSFDPEIDLEAAYALIAKWRAGTICRANWQVGTAAGNKFLCSVAGMQTTGAPTGERSGISTRSWEYQATSGHMTNAGDAAGVDNDIVITYLL